MNPLASFDLEIAKELPEYECPVCGGQHIQEKNKMGMCLECTTIDPLHKFRSDWKNHRPLGITCAATFERVSAPLQFINKPMTAWVDYEHDAVDIVNGLINLTNDGYEIVTWNGLSFDFDVLAEESGMYKECAELALNHVDLMFIVVTLRGHFLGLDKAAKGVGIKGKLHEVTLSDGTILEDMSGARAPELWKAGEYQAVLDYLADDVRSTLELAEWVRDNKKIRWTSEKGYEQVIHVPKLYTVKECLDLNPILPKWVTNPVSKKSMMEWIDK